MNCRQLTIDELADRALYSFAGQQSAVDELIRRANDSAFISVTKHQDLIENAQSESFDEGVDDGMLSERELIFEWFADHLVFGYKDKIESNVMDQLLTDMRDQFPELPRGEKNA